MVENMSIVTSQLGEHRYDASSGMVDVAAKRRESKIVIDCQDEGGGHNTNPTLGESNARPQSIKKMNRLDIPTGLSGEDKAVGEVSKNETEPREGDGPCLPITDLNQKTHSKSTV